MKKIPYGVSNFKDLRDKNMYYIDKTKYIEKLESKPDYQFFIRPRRFGKSLFLTMLEAYYDIYEKENFQRYFGDLFVGSHRTTLSNTYLILSISFADVISDQGKEMLIQSFDEIVCREVNSCIEKYSDILKKDTLPSSKNTATFALGFLSSIAKPVAAKIFLLIDEYDNFANNIMANDKELYHTLTHQDGYIKTFYKSIKEGTRDGVISRAFITGVSPIMLDDLTSGANIFEVTSNDEDLNELLGFTKEDLEDIINEYEIDKKLDKQELLQTLKTFCDGYRFTRKNVPTVYNTDMVLYILKSIIATGEYPHHLIDENVKTDYTRLRKIAEFFTSKDELNQIILTGKTVPVELQNRFNLESLHNEADRLRNIRSLLYYIGMLTIHETRGNKVVLKIPNYAIKELYWDYMLKSYNIHKSTGYDTLMAAMDKMRLEGDTTPIMDIYEKVINVMSTRDLKDFNEATCKAFFITLLYTDGIYLIASEREASGGFSDLYAKENILYADQVKFRYLIEFKHIKAGELKGNFTTNTKEDIVKNNEKIIQKNKDEAKNQLHQYIKDYNILNDSDRILKKYTIVVLGRHFIVVDEVQ